MHRTGPILLAAAALLTGCSPGSSTPATVTVPSPAPAAATSPAESTTPTDPGIFASQFHPCEVFTEEQFAEAGLGKRTNAKEDPNSRVRACGINPLDLDSIPGTFLVGTDTTDRAHIRGLGLEEKEWPSSRVNDLYVHQILSQSRSCAAAVDFSWGRFFVSYQELGEGGPLDDVCAYSASTLESLILQMGETHGTQN